MKIYIGTDHAGYELKETLKTFLGALGHTVVDKGAGTFDPADDYPLFVRPVAEAVVVDPESLGIVLGGSGTGEGICANRVLGARAAVFYGGQMEIVRLAREHNNANILSLGARFLTKEEAQEAVQIFLETKFSGDERHVRRIAELEK